MFMAPKPKQPEALSSQWERLRAAAPAHLARGVRVLVRPLRVLGPDTSDRGPASGTSKRSPTFSHSTELEAVAGTGQPWN